MKPEEPVSPEVARLYMSLLGGVAWTTQTRVDIIVFVSALQRRLKQPRVQDVINLNRVLKYLKLKPLCLRYRKVGKPWKLMAISDSSFKGEGQEHLAVRSGIIGLVDRDGPHVGDNAMQVVEMVSKKQSRVCRSTFAAELLSAIDLTGTAFRINSALSEILEGCTSATQLLSKQESMTHALELDLAIDAFSVWTRSTVEEIRCSDGALFLHLLAFRELLGKGVKRLLWIDTRDMVSDGLNKGTVDRTAIRILSELGIWKVQHEPKIHTFASTHAQAQTRQHS